MIEVAAEGDFFVFQVGIGAGDCGGDDFAETGMLAGFDGGVELDFFAGGEALLQRARGFERNHKSEGFVGRESFEVAPTDEILIVAGPGGRLILCVADDSGGAEFSYGDVLHGAGLSGG